MGVGHQRAAIIVLASFALPVLTDVPESGGYFVTPPAAAANQDYSQNKVYYVGEEVELQWVTDAKINGLFLWQQGNGTQYSTIFSNVTSPNNSYPWTVELAYSDVTFNITPTADTPGNVFFFDIQADDNSNVWFTSHYFNISNTEPSSGASSAIASQTNSPQTSSTSDPTVTPTSSTSASSSGLNSAQEAGIGVGISLVGLLAIAALVWFLRFRQPKHLSRTEDMLAYPTRNSGPDNEYGKGHHGHQISEMTAERHFELPEHRQDHELGAPNQSQELP